MGDRSERGAFLKNRRVWLYVAAAVVVAALGWMVLSPKGSKGKPRTAQVERGRIVATVSATGTINPVVQVEQARSLLGRTLAREDLTSS